MYVYEMSQITIDGQHQILPDLVYVTMAVSEIRSK